MEGLSSITDTANCDPHGQSQAHPSSRTIAEVGQCRVGLCDIGSINDERRQPRILVGKQRTTRTNQNELTLNYDYFKHPPKNGTTLLHLLPANCPPNLLNWCHLCHVATMFWLFGLSPPYQVGGHRK